MQGQFLGHALEQRLAGRLALSLVVLLVGASMPCRGAEYASEAEIKQAIEKSKTFLLQDIERGTNRASIGAVALLKAGVKPSDKRVKKVLDDLASRCQGDEFKPYSRHASIYEATVYIMAFANSEPDKYKAEIQFLVDWLIKSQRADGGWEYPDEKESADTSQSQYALLGLWEASIQGVEIDQSVFDRAVRWHLATQRKDGGFTYEPGQGGTTSSTHSMTAAGTGSLHICRMFMFPSTKDSASPFAGDSSAQKKKASDRKKFGVLEDPDLVEAELEKSATKSAPRRTVGGAALNASIGRSLGWLNQNFVVSNPTGWPMYYLYSLERAMALANIEEELGNHAWYREGATHLVRSQNERGDWRGNGGPGPSTAFGLMFLTRATHKTLGRRRVRRKIGGGLLAGGRGLPDDLSSTSIEGGTVKQRKMTGPVDELLAVLEDPKNANFFQAQEALVETVILGDPKALVGKTDKLLKLASTKNDEVRRTAMWALGRSQDITVVPTLIQALNDPNLDTMVEARNALRFISKRIDGFGLPAQPSDKERERAIASWKKWYLTVRPYDEQDDLLTVEQ